jgi:hypothetical protein
VTHGENENLYRVFCCRNFLQSSDFEHQGDGRIILMVAFREYFERMGTRSHLIQNIYNRLMAVLGLPSNEVTTTARMLGQRLFLLVAPTSHLTWLWTHMGDFCTGPVLTQMLYM